MHYGQTKYVAIRLFCFVIDFGVLNYLYKLINVLVTYDEILV